MSIAWVHTDTVHTIPVRYQSSAERRNAQNIGTFLKYNPVTSQHKCSQFASVKQCRASHLHWGTLQHTPKVRERRGGKKNNFFAFALQGCSQRHFQTGSSLESSSLSSVSCFLPRENAVIDCRWAPPLPKSPVQSFGLLLHICLIWRCLLRCGTWTLASPNFSGLPGSCFTLRVEHRYMYVAAQHDKVLFPSWGPVEVTAQISF